MHAVSRFAAVAAAAVLAGLVPGATPAAVRAAADEKTCQLRTESDGDQLSASRLARLAEDAGFTGDGLVDAVAVALAESKGYTRAVLVNKDCTRDRGLWQINDYWHPEVSEQQAFDPVQNAKAAFEISDQGTSWHQWSTYENGLYKDYLPDAEQAVRNPA